MHKKYNFLSNKLDSVSYEKQNKGRISAILEEQLNKTEAN